MKAMVLTVAAASVASLEWLIWPSLIVISVVIRLITCHFELKNSEKKCCVVDFDADELKEMFKDEID